MESGEEFVAVIEKNAITDDKYCYELLLNSWMP